MTWDEMISSHATYRNGALGLGGPLEVPTIHSHRLTPLFSQ